MRILLKYAKANWVWVLVASYMLFSCILKLTTEVNITIPCLFRTFLGRTCPGCGLTHAFMDLLMLNPIEAWNHNPLIFLVLPAAGFFISSDFLRFRKKQVTSAIQ